MTNTVRKKWLNELRRRLAAITTPGGGVGLVVESGSDDAGIGRTLAAGQHALEVATDEDVVEPGITNKIECTTRVEIVAHLAPVSGMTPEEVAMDLCAEIYMVYGASDEAGSLKQNASGANPGLVYDCEPEALCGGCIPGEIANFTYHRLRVKWAHKRGEPTTTM